jgi:hypothetical protein
VVQARLVAQNFCGAEDSVSVRFAMQNSVSVTCL